MSNAIFKIDDASTHITQALNNFLKDKNLRLTDQQYIRLKKLLMVRLLDEDITYESAYQHLCDIKEYRKDYEINANAPNEAEEEMIRIIGAADIEQVEVTVEVDHYKKRFIVAVALLGVMCAGVVFLMANQYVSNKKIEMLASAQVINTAEEDQIKALVQQIVTMETKNGNKITHSAVYKEMKELEGIQSLGEARSYKKFDKAQHKVAVEYLSGRLKP